jgi:hypothetical protein
MVLIQPLALFFEKCQLFFDKNLEPEAGIVVMSKMCCIKGRGLSNSPAPWPSKLLHLFAF